MGDSRRYHPWTLYFGASWSLLAALIMLYIWYRNPWIRNIFFNTTVVICSLGIWQFFWIVLPEGCWLEGFGEYSVAVFDTLLTAFFTYLSFRFVWDLTEAAEQLNDANNGNDTREVNLSMERMRSNSQVEEVRSGAKETGGNQEEYHHYETPEEEEEEVPKEVPTSVEGESLNNNNNDGGGSNETKQPRLVRDTTTQMLQHLNLQINVVGNLDFQFRLSQLEWYGWLGFSVCWFFGFVVTATASNLYGDWTPWCMIYDVEYRVILYHGQAYALAAYLVFILSVSTYRVSQSHSAANSWQWKAQSKYMFALLIRVMLKFVSVWRCTALLIDPRNGKADKMNRHNCALQCQLIGFFTPFVLSTIPAASWLRIHYDILPVLFGFAEMDDRERRRTHTTAALA